MLFEEYDTHFFGDDETLDFIEFSLSNVIRRKYRYDDSLQLRVTTERPLDAYIINYLRKTHDFMIYVTYGTRDCGCWSFCNGKEISASLNHHRRDMYGSRSYKKFVDKENLLMDVTYNLLHGMSYKGLVDIAKLADVEENLLIQKCYLVDPVYEYQVYEYQDIVLDEETSAENSRKYLEFCKANKNMVENVDPEKQSILESWQEPIFFNADKENVIKLLSSGDLEVCWYWHLTVYEYAALALPEIQRRLKARDESVLSRLEHICFLLDIDDVSSYKDLLIKSRNFGE